MVSGRYCELEELGVMIHKRTRRVGNHVIILIINFIVAFKSFGTVANN